jgi:hypothetical protein
MWHNCVASFKDDPHALMQTLVEALRSTSTSTAASISPRP